STGSTEDNPFPIVLNLNRAIKRIAIRLQEALDVRIQRLAIQIQVFVIGHSSLVLSRSCLSAAGVSSFYRSVKSSGLWGPELQKWWAQQDLNLRPIDYESSALTN